MAVEVVVGNPRPGSRTLGLAAAVGARVADLLGVGMSVTDLATLEGDLLNPAAAGTASALARLHAADVIVIASPTYKGAYTGVLKVFLDHVGGGALDGQVALPVMTGGTRDHSLALDVHLRPVLLTLGATLPTQGLYVSEAELPDLDAVVDRWWSGARAATVNVVRRAVR